MPASKAEQVLDALKALLETLPDAVVQRNSVLPEKDSGRRPDPLGRGERDGFYQAQLIRDLAVRHITGWTGVELEGGPAPPTPENIAAVMELYPVGERFFQEFTLRQVLLNAAKNGCGPSAAGTFSLVEGPNTAEPAATTASPAPEASPEPTAGSAPTASTP